ncbi:MAG: CxxC-x17-CxxC domain-containing protein [Candidatus Anstonellaceae archaeon]
MEEENENNGGLSGQSRKMYDAVCSKCHKPCQVPFQPQEGRPVYCRDCYRPRRRY